MLTSALRVGVVGAGAMGFDHIKRLSGTITGAVVSAVIEPDEDRRDIALAHAPEAQGFASVDEAIAAGALDAALIATPGQFHEAGLLTCLQAGLPILCEKPLTKDPESSWRVVEAEIAGGKKLVQVGFMRRFDPEYEQLRELIASGRVGELLMIHAVHRNPSVPDSYDQPMLINDSVVHEFDVGPWLAGGSVTSVEVRHGRRNPNTPAHLKEPILVLMELDNGVLIDVEMNVSVRFGYQVATEAVMADGIARIGQPSGLQVWQNATFSIPEHADFTTRFTQAYDRQVQAWVTAARRFLTGEAAEAVAGPSAWDGYRVAVCCAAGVTALDRSGPVPVELPPVPEFYR
ncbi:inositol 2-dehydrogenase [Gordonia hirsuta DSM 44140 = NBRC 16056]|uniref:Inositol 2-dehydrogenase n=1 Tax=Gordonia hirsuta DSM 44140 = NBRC 16056 TaxID=1121927 RepID=L7LCH1_9ACTN|nr:Gfo/Idh/MocA family oxidoreductase [Gordonia hirsuta]GAC57777.1 inositol 2-dehydrogenase [Gordonia hirsuta DSM 44140 = NBRC 16056]